MRVVVVANPNARRSTADLDDVRAALTGLGQVSVVASRSKDTFADEVRASPSDLVVVAGGDGTLNDAVNALADRLGEVSFALVPMGTGNDLARTLGVPLDAVEAARAAADGLEREIDLWTARSQRTSRLFLNACMGGMPAQVDEAVDPSLKRLAGPLAFWVAGAKVGIRLPRSTVTVNGRVVRDCVAVGVASGRTCAGGLQLWPRALVDDGALDCVALPARGRAAAVRLAASLKAATHEQLPDVVVLRDERVVIASEPAIEFNVDGELVGLETPVSFEPAGRVRVRAPHP